MKAWFILFFIIFLVFDLITLWGAKQFMITDKSFVVGDEEFSYSVYRMLGNDLPPLQEQGQARHNSKYALQYESVFPNVRKRWVLNHIWNASEFEEIYRVLLFNGAHRRDILSICFDMNDYSSLRGSEEKLSYLISVNEAKNLAITDGRDSGFEWSLILDGSTFVTEDSWDAIEHVLKHTSGKELFMKIPFHRLGEPQDEEWLNGSTSMNTVLSYAPTRGESQIAVHKSANKDLFPTGGRGRGGGGGGGMIAGHAHLFRQGGVCSPHSNLCVCTHIEEGDENLRPMERDRLRDKGEEKAYVKECGMVLRLWHYPSDDWHLNGLGDKDEADFFCYLEEEWKDPKGSQTSTPCEGLRDHIKIWDAMKDTEKKKYETGINAGLKCKHKFTMLFSEEPCFRAAARETGHQTILKNIDTANNDKKLAPYLDQSFCKSLKIKSNNENNNNHRNHYLTVFDESTLKNEREAFEDKGSASFKSISPLIHDLIKKADKALKNGPYSVMDKRKKPEGTSDKRYYYSVRPFWWEFNDCPIDVQTKAKNGMIQMDDRKFVHRDGVRVPGTYIGGRDDDLYDRSNAWYMADNVTTLSLAWYFTRENKYSKWAATLVKKYFINEQTAMYPTLEYAQDGTPNGLIEWKDVYYLLDAFTMLEHAEALDGEDVDSLKKWCAKLSRWMMKSPQGREEALQLSNHGLFFDLTVLSLALYAHDDNTVDDARTRLYYRLSKPFPLGHFDSDGTQPFETSRPNALHSVAFNLAGWVHAALIVDAASAHCEVPRGMKSLWEVKHEDAGENAAPVLLKAIRWLAMYLPEDAKSYQMITEPKENRKGMGVNFPFDQKEPFSFDRMLEIVRYGCNVYGASRIFSNIHNPEAKTFFDYPQYSTNYASLNEFNSIHPDSGNRAWPALGMFVKGF